MNGLSAPCLCAVTARQRLSPGARTAKGEVRALRVFLDDLIGAGVDMVQIREADLEESLLVEVVAGAVATARDRATRIVVGSRPDVALTTAADGVHLKEADTTSAADIRARAPQLLIGRSVHGERLSTEGALDYLIFGTTYRTASKPDAPVAGLRVLTHVVERTATPVLAIGGVTPGNANACLAAGAAGVAAIGVFLPPGLAPEALGARAAVASFREAFTL